MASKGVKKAPNKKKNANGYKLPEPIAKGEILEDMTKKQWIIGSSIGVGGFGEIYSAAPYNGKPPKDYPAVVKIEPHGNGPLFVEMHFYMRNAKPADIDAWKKEKKLSTLGMPRYVGSGSHEYKNTKYRFVVMDRYSTDLWKLFEQNGRKFPVHTVYKVGVQIINVLEYIHNKTYVHADIKGGNLLLDLNSQNQVYLVDFGLASHYTTKPEYKLDPKKAHNGTIEYTSRDAHMGVPTMRSDFEILSYNMIQWLTGSLPWEKQLSDPVSVQKEKEKAFQNIDAFLDQCFSGNVPEPIRQYMNLLDTLKFNDTPDYNKFRDILIKGLMKLGHKVDGNLEFNNKINVTPKDSKKTNARRINNVDVVRKSPRTKAVKSDTPVQDNLDESIYGLVIDKKHQTVEEMKKLLDSMDPNDEYYLQIKRKSNKRKLKGKAEEDVSTVVEKPVVKRGRKKVEDSEPEVRNKGTKATPKKVPTNVEKKKINQIKGRKKLLDLNTANDDDDSDSEPEVLNKGTRSRPKRVPTKVEEKKINRLSTGSESDIFLED